LTTNISGTDEDIENQIGMWATAEEDQEWPGKTT